MSMLMRIAKGIHASLSGAPSIAADTEWETMSDDERAAYVTAAVLTILRNPTDQMLAEGNREGFPKDAANVWERMAYRALHED